MEAVDELVVVAAWIVAGNVEKRLRDRQRGAQLVGGIGGESLLFGDLCFEPREHAVEGVGEFTELVPAALQPDSVGERPGRGQACGRCDASQRGEHLAREKPSSQQTEHEQEPHHHRRLRNESADEVGTAGAEGSGSYRITGIRHVAQEEHPHDGEQQGAGEQDEPGVAEGEFEADAQARGSIHGLLPRARVRPGVDAVAGAGDGGDDPGFAEPFAQCRDRDAHGVGERVGVLIPRPFEELFGADDTAFGGDEDFEHGELLAGQRDVAAVAVDLAAERIQPQAGDLAHRWPVVGAPAVECSEPEHEFLELEGLGEVVVGAELEPGGLVVEPVGGGEHEDRHAAAGGDDAFGDLVTGGPGDVAVEDGDVVGVDAQQLQSGVAVARDVGRDRFQAQAVADRFRHIGLVLDEQYAHAPRLRAGAYRRHIENRIRAGNTPLP